MPANDVATLHLRLRRLRRFPLRRAGMLLASTLTMGVGVTLLVNARLGLLPIDVLHWGTAHRFGFTFGGGIIAVQSVLLLIALPLRVAIGPGTVLAFLIPALTTDTLQPLLPHPDNLAIRIGLFTAGGILFCTGVAGYLTATLGILPRDGIMLTLGRDRPRGIAVARIGIDVAFVLVGGALLGPGEALRHGDIGVGTVILAIACGPAVAVLRHIIAHFPGFSRQDEGQT